MKRILTIGVVAALIIFIGVETSLLFKGDIGSKKISDPLASLQLGNYAAEKDHWKDEINKVGTEKAYELFKQDTQPKTFGVSHTLAHIFGDLIYQKEGIDGIVYCDSSFAFGCYHSFFGAAITDHGIDVVPELDKLCVERWGLGGLGCPHGIGHGLLDYMGYDKLVDALKVCSTLSWKKAFGGCQSGVFMEYNFHTMQSFNGGSNRSFDPKNPTYPCESVPQGFKQACYYELSPWLSNTFSKDYAKVGTICADVKNQLSKEACFIGLGNTIAPDFSYDVSKSIASCDLMPDHSSMILCRAGAAWSLFAEPTTRDSYPLICKGLSDSEEKTCIEKSKII